MTIKAKETHHYTLPYGERRMTNPIRLNPGVAAWIRERKGYSKSRISDLFLKAEIESSEVVLAGIIFVMTVLKIVLDCHGIHPIAYIGVNKIWGSFGITVMMVTLCVLSVCAFMLYCTPKLRRNIDLLVATFFVWHGSVMLLGTTIGGLPGYYSTFPWVEVFVFGATGMWIRLRQRPKKDGYFEPVRRRQN